MENTYKIYRCKFIDETSEYIIGKDVFNNNKYYINKNNESKNFKVGSDNSFYALKKTVGKIFKKEVLEPIEYEKLIKNKK